MQNLCKNNFVCRLESPSEVYLQQNQEDVTKNRLANSKHISTTKIGKKCGKLFFLFKRLEFVHDVLHIEHFSRIQAKKYPFHSKCNASKSPI